MQKSVTPPKAKPIHGHGEDQGMIPIAVLLTAIMLIVVLGATIYMLASSAGNNSLPNYSAGESKQLSGSDRPDQTHLTRSIVEDAQTSPNQAMPQAATTQRNGELQMLRTEPKGPVPIVQGDRLDEAFSPGHKSDDPALNVGSRPTR